MTNFNQIFKILQIQQDECLRIITNVLYRNWWMLLPGRLCVCTHQMVALFESKNPTPSFDVYLLEKQSCQISSRSDLKRRSLGVFMRASNKKKRSKMSSDMRSVPGSKKCLLSSSVNWFRVSLLFNCVRR